jgi:hypothetical protein
MSPSFLTEAEVEARNAEHKIGELILEDACVYLYRGEIHIQCCATDQCDDRCDEDCHWLIRPGESLIVEVYDRAGKSIFFDCEPADLNGLAAIALGTEVGVKR